MNPDDILAKIQKATAQAVMVLPFAERVELRVESERLYRDDVLALYEELGHWLRERGLIEEAK